ncbi:MAG: 30S ribosomal protein S20 [Planctomycetota bacterium]
MPNTKQAEKAARQNIKRYLRNKMIKTKVKTLIKKFKEAITNKDKDNIAKLYKQAQSAIDKAWVKGVIHKNNAARKKHKLSLIFNKAFKS